MSWFTNLRILAFCRRGIRALESIAESQRTIAQVTQDEWNAKHAPKPPTQSAFSTFDHDGASTRWEEEQRLKSGA